MGNQINIYQNDKYSYIGQIKNNKYHGDGTIYYNETGNLYKGQFKNGLKHGFGEFKFFNGDKYIGEFYQDEMHGEGIYYSNNEIIYKGKFILGCLVGKGQMYNIYDELIYDGEFLNSFPHGFGIYFTNKQITYIGNWNQNFYNGYGVLVENNIKKYGIFQDGELIQQITEIPKKFLKYLNKKDFYDSNIKITKFTNTVKINPLQTIKTNTHELNIRIDKSKYPLYVDKNNISEVKNFFKPINVR